VGDGPKNPSLQIKMHNRENVAVQQLKVMTKKSRHLREELTC